MGGRGQNWLPCVWGGRKGSDMDLPWGEEGHLPQVAKAGLAGCHLSKCSFLLCCGLRLLLVWSLFKGGTGQVLHFPAVPAERGVAGGELACQLSNDQESNKS